MSKIKLKLVFSFTIISVIVGYAFKELSWIVDSELAESILAKDNSVQLTPDRFTGFMLLTVLGYYIGVLFSFVTSTFIAIKLKLGMLNVVLALIISYLLKMFIIGSVIISPGQYITTSLFWAGMTDLILFSLTAFFGYFYLIKKHRIYKHNTH
jgi:hypothetical protein